MKKSQLKALIREVISEVGGDMDVSHRDTEGVVGFAKKLEKVLTGANLRTMHGTSTSTSNSRFKNPKIALYFNNQEEMNDAWEKLKSKGKLVSTQKSYYNNDDKDEYIKFGNFLINKNSIHSITMTGSGSGHSKYYLGIFTTGVLRNKALTREVAGGHEYKINIKFVDVYDRRNNGDIDINVKAANDHDAQIKAIKEFWKTHDDSKINITDVIVDDENIPWGQHKDDWLPGGAGDPAHDKKKVSGSDFVNHVKNKPFVVVVTDSDTNKKREVGFDDYDAAMNFKLAAEEDGTYWGFHQNKV